jgi:hypothetical protein
METQDRRFYQPLPIVEIAAIDRGTRPHSVELDRLPDKEFEEDDPYELVAVEVPSPPGYDGPAEMARCFVEEFALMGFPPDRILRLFTSRAFAGSHAIYEERGEAFVRGLIDEVFTGRKGERDGNGV